MVDGISRKVAVAEVQGISIPRKRLSIKPEKSAAIKTVSCIFMVEMDRYERRTVTATIHFHQEDKQVGRANLKNAADKGKAGSLRIIQF